jgi:hypothetical protein
MNPSPAQPPIERLMGGSIPTRDQSAARASRAIGSMFFSVFGGAWLALWWFSTHARRPLVLSAVIAGSTILFLASLRQFRQNRDAHAAEAESAAAKREGRVFNIVNAVQWILIFAVASILSISGHREWIIPAFIFIVGAHFLPLGAAFSAPRHYLTGAAMIALAILYPFMARSGPASPIGCLGAGMILWASAVAALIPSLNPNPAPN